MSREDLYVSTSVNGKVGKGEEEDFERTKKNQVYATVRKRLDSPIKHAFNDSLWGGAWGLLMATSIIWSTDSNSEEDILRIGIGGGILLGLTSSFVYNFIQRKKINDLSTGIVEKNIFTYYDPKHASWNLAYAIRF